MRSLKKYCPDCNRNRFRYQFQKNSSRGDGLQVYCRDCQNLRNSENKVRFPEKTRARQLVAAAVKSGALKPQFLCSGCSINIATDAHHEDYGKPLEVIWLCRSCHQKIHRGGDQ